MKRYQRISKYSLNIAWPLEIHLKFYLVFSWYMGSISRKEAETLVLMGNNRPGTFLVRTSESLHGKPTCTSGSINFLDLENQI